jgi:phosphatidylglycerol:prolipoprotein diacylglycerol transferase
MLPFVRVGPLLLPLPGLALLAGIWIGTNIVEQQAVRLRLNAVSVLNMIMVGLIGGLLGARLLYALEHIDAYVASPLSLFALSATAMDAWGGLLVGVAVAYLHGRAKGLPLRLTLDALAPGLAVFMTATGLANLLSGDGYGSPLQAPWAIRLWGEYRHPTQIYEMLLAVGVFLIWKFASMGTHAPGQSFWRVLAFLAAARTFTEAFHGDSAVLPGGFRLAQMAGLLVLGAAMYMDRRWAPPESASPDEPPTTRRRATPARRPVKAQIERARSPRSKPARTRPK